MKGLFLGEVISYSLAVEVQSKRTVVLDRLQKSKHLDQIKSSY